MKTASPEELRRMIGIVEAKLTSLPATSVHSLATFDAHRKAVTKALAELRTEVGARVNDKWDGCSLRIGGIAVTCTAGGEGAMRNWLKRAKFKVAENAGRAA